MAEDPIQQRTRTVLAIVYFLNAVFLIVGLAVFYLKRNVFPIEQRGLKDLFGYSATLLIFTSFFAFPFRSCQEHIVLSFGSMSVLLWDARALRLLFRYHVQNSMFNIAQLERVRPSEEKANMIEVELRSFFVRNRKYARWRWLIFPTMAFLVLCVILNAVSYGISTHECQDGGFMHYFTISSIGCLLVIGVFLALNFRGFASDSHKMKQEMLLGGAGLLVIYALYEVCFRALPPSLAWVSALVGVEIIPFIAVVSVWWPLSMTRLSSTQEKQFASLQANAQRDPDFRAFLLTEDGSASWHSFLLSEFSLENILFWDAAREWKSDVVDMIRATDPNRTEIKEGRSENTDAEGRPSGTTCTDSDSESVSKASGKSSISSGGDSIAELERRARSKIRVKLVTKTEAIEACLTIIAQHIAQDAQAQINIQHRTSRKLECHDQHTLRRLDLEELSTVFDAAAHQVFMLMENDSWPRYQRSRAYWKLLQLRARSNSKSSRLESCIRSKIVHSRASPAASPLGSRRTLGNLAPPASTMVTVSSRPRDSGSTIVTQGMLED